MQKENLINEFLMEFSKLEPNASKNLTKRIKKMCLDKNEIKAQKIKIIFIEYKQVTRQISEKMFGHEKSQHHSLGFSSNLLFNSIFEITNEEPVNGSFGSKYNSNQVELK